MSDRCPHGLYWHERCPECIAKAHPESEEARLLRGSVALQELAALKAKLIGIKEDFDIEATSCFRKSKIYRESSPAYRAWTSRGTMAHEAMLKLKNILGE
jgi:hypothetical protein